MIDLLSLTQELADAAQHENHQAVIVAGQALNFWGAYYLNEGYTEEQLSPLASKDIDFYEQKSDRVRAYVRNLQEAMTHSQYSIISEQYPSPYDPTINTALIELSHPDAEAPIIIDFIWAIDGLQTSEVEKHIDRVTLGSHQLSILSPVYCLKARIHNLLYLYPRLGKSEDRIKTELDRVKLGLDIVKLHLKEVQELGQIRSFKKRLKVITKIAKIRMGRDLLDKYGLSILDAIPMDIMDSRFIEFELPDLQKKLSRN